MTREKALLDWTEGNKARLRQNLEHLEQGWADKKRMLDETEREISDVKLQMQVYDQFLTQASEILSGPNEDEHDDRPSPTAAVLALVDETPGITRAELISRLEGTVRSKSPRPDRVISAAVSRGKKEGTFWEGAGGRLYRYEHPEAIKARGGSSTSVSNVTGITGVT